MPIASPWKSLFSGVAPQAAGVYELGDPNGTVLYIGSSGDLEQRIAQHAAAPSNSCIGRRATHFRYEQTSAYREREKELFREYKRTHNGRIPPCNDVDPS